MKLNDLQTQLTQLIKERHGLPQDAFSEEAKLQRQIEKIAMKQYKLWQCVSSTLQRSKF